MLYNMTLHISHQYPISVSFVCHLFSMCNAAKRPPTVLLLCWAIALCKRANRFLVWRMHTPHYFFLQLGKRLKESCSCFSAFTGTRQIHLISCTIELCHFHSSHFDPNHLCGTSATTYSCRTKTGLPHPRRGSTAHFCMRWDARKSKSGRKRGACMITKLCSPKLWCFI